MFSKVLNTLNESGMIPSSQVYFKRAHQQHVAEQDNVLGMVKRNPATRMQTHSTRPGVSRTRIWRKLHHAGLYQFNPQSVPKLHPVDCFLCLDICRWLHINRQFLPLILFTVEVPFTRK
jgi:hypothetical protein